MRHIGLFAGIGGFELAARWMGWNTIAWSEWDPFCQKVLSYHFPEAKGYGDIKQADFTQYRGQCDILTGGFPCQPYSVAGKRLGKEDERHLWPEMLRVIREVQPRWIVGENVRGLLSWNEGVVFEEVCTDLESEGYEVQAFIIPAAGVGAPHRRERVWIIAYNNGILWREGRKFEPRKQSRHRESNENCNTKINKYATNADSNGFMQNRRHDRCCENVNGCNSEKFRTANTKDFDRCSSNGNTKTQSRINNRTCIKRIYEKDKIANSNRVCRMDKNIGEPKGYIRENKFEINESRALVQERQSGVQLSDNRRLGEVKKSLSSPEGYGLQNDLPRFSRLDRIPTNSESKRLPRGSWTESTFRECSGYGQENLWENFPTISPVCGGDDGLPSELDGITFPKWRKESIKAYGNAIVPQVAYQLFQAIKNTKSLVF